MRWEGGLRKGNGEKWAEEKSWRGDCGIRNAVQLKKSGNWGRAQQQKTENEVSLPNPPSLGLGPP